MKRAIYKDLLEWKNSSSRKPLVLYGARQTGKTWLLREFGKNEYKNVVELNFDSNRELHQFFGDNLDGQKIIAGLSAYFRTGIKPAETLLIFDEIQECQRAKDSLKYFNENAGQYHIAAAGSFLGIAGGKFPVGQINRLDLYPMSFSEFMQAAGENQLLDVMQVRDFALVSALKDRFTELLKTYMYVGGMPEAVKTYAETRDSAAVRTVQETILSSYKDDFANHITPADIPKVRMLWDSIPVHLAKEKKKFMYKEIKKGGRAAEFENALNWLVNTGLVQKINRITDPRLPLSSYGEREHFKLYMLDVGLLAAKAPLDISTLMLPNNPVFTEFKGALTEQYVIQELRGNTKSPVFYWGSDSGKAEVDFIIQHKNEIVPIEVKSSINTKAQSLSVYIDKYHPVHAVRSSLKNYGKDGRISSIPLYMIGNIEELLV
jgi:predicted AAA+ superfamily ATPase